MRDGNSYKASAIKFYLSVQHGRVNTGSRPFFSKWSSTSDDRKIALVCDKALK